MAIDIDLNLDLTHSESKGVEAPVLQTNNRAENVLHVFAENTSRKLLQFDLNVEPDASERGPIFEEVEVQSAKENNPPCEEVEDFLEHDTVAITNGTDPPCEDEDFANNETLALMNDLVEGDSSGRKRGFLTNEQRRAISHLLLHSSEDGKLKSGTTTRVASLYGVHRSVIYRIWNQVKEIGDASHRRARNCGRKRVQLDNQRVREVPLSKRTTLRSLASALNINKTSLTRLQKAGVIRRHSNAIKPYLKEKNKIARLKFCLSMLEENSIPHDPKFKPMHNVVHIDEKWFYVTKRTTKYYLLADEDEPHRTCKSKNFIEKLMFLVAVARPRLNDQGNEIFSRKIGVFPLVNEQAARRTSVNRVARTMEKKPITSVTKEVCKMYLIDKVLPAIKEKWPREDLGKTIFIQQDNARCHVAVDDADFCQAASEGGFDIHLTCQPPNSPDLNVLDLGFFNAIQSLQEKEVAKSIDSLIDAVEKSFDAFSARQSEKIFVTLQATMIEIMKSKGSNDRKTPHLRKDVLYRHGRLPTQLPCDASLIQEVFHHLENVDASQE